MAFGGWGRSMRFKPSFPEGQISRLEAMQTMVLAFIEPIVPASVEKADVTVPLPFRDVPEWRIQTEGVVA